MTSDSSVSSVAVAGNDGDSCISTMVVVGECG